MLQLSDIPKTISTIPTASSSLSGGATLLTHELFTNDVLYAEAALDLTGLPAGLLPLLPLFCRSLTQVGGWVRTLVSFESTIDAGGVLVVVVLQ
jgi:Zn-dependent M16 (insulinase) family peptidase